MESSKQNGIVGKYIIFKGGLGYWVVLRVKTGVSSGDGHDRKVNKVF